MKVTISVTQEHLKRQERGACLGCAFALAITEKLSAGYEAYVLADRWQLQYHGKRIKTERIPRDSCFVIRQLDHDYDFVLPHTFTTDIPREYLKAEAAA